MRDNMAVRGDRPERLEERAATCVAPMHRGGAAARVVPTRTPPLHSRRWRSAACDRARPRSCAARACTATQGQPTTLYCTRNSRVEVRGQGQDPTRSAEALEALATKGNKNGGEGELTVRFYMREPRPKIQPHLVPPGVG